MAVASLRTFTVRSGAAINTSVAVALVAATAKTVIGAFAPSTTPMALHRFQLSFDSVAAAAVPALVEVGITTAAGTSTAFTPVQVTGSTLASSVAAGYNYTVEPTYNRILHTSYVPIFNGYLSEWFPLGFEPQADASQGIAIRVTAPAAANCLASFLFSE